MNRIPRTLLQKSGLYAPLQSWRDHSLARKLLQHFVAPGDLCFDVGAHTGEISEVLTRLGAYVVAIEPERSNLLELEERLRRYPARTTIVPVALGAAPGRAELMVCNSSDCCSLSVAFVNSVQSSGRLPGGSYRWDESESVPVETLDRLILKLGVPSFIKIDVEGFEYEVLKGLSTAVRQMMFEFTPEFLDPALNSISRLASLGNYRFNYHLGRSPKFALQSWLEPGDFCRSLRAHQFPVNNGPAGDILARLT